MFYAGHIYIYLTAGMNGDSLKLVLPDDSFKIILLYYYIIFLIF